jgi:hypothetical protein
MAKSTVFLGASPCNTSQTVFQEETLVHLFWFCHFAQNCWDSICFRARNLKSLEVFYDIREKMNLPFSMEVIILAACGIWIVRSSKIFKDQAHLSKFESNLCTKPQNDCS